MDRRKYLLISSCVFGLVAAMHLFRVIGGLPLMLGSWTLPMWASMLACVVLGLLSYMGNAYWRKGST